MRSFLLQTILWLAIAIPLPVGFLQAEDLDVRKMLPASTVIYVEVQSLESVIEHPFTKTLQGTPAFKKLWRSPNVMKLRGGLTLFEFAIGDKVDNLVKNLSANGFYLAVDKSTEGAVLLANTTSQEWIEDYLQKLVKLARADAKSKKQTDPIREADYRGIHGYEFQKMIVGNIGPILIVSNKGELGKSIIDCHLDSKDDSLLNKPLFRQAWNEKGTEKPEGKSDRMARAFVDIEGLRQAGFAKDILMEKTRDFAGELILGGLLASLQKTSFATGELRMEEKQLFAQFSIPYEKQWTGETRSFFVGPDSSGYASKLVDGAGMMASLNAYRNVSELWCRAADLFDQKVNDQLAQADSTLTTLFSGKDFGTDILGAVEPQIQLIASEQTFEKSSVPSIQLPSFGFVARLKDPRMQKGLKRIFQSFIGFLNVSGAMEGNPQLDLESETIGGKQIYYATYLQDSDKKYENGLPIQFNFSPALAFDGDLVMITSTSALSKQLKLNETKTIDVKDPQNNTVLNLDMRAIKRTLLANRQQMISQNMLEKGHTKSEAEMEIDTLLQLLSLMSKVNASLLFNEFVTLGLNLDLETGN